MRIEERAKAHRLTNAWRLTGKPVHANCLRQLRHASNVGCNFGRKTIKSAAKARKGIK